MAEEHRKTRTPVICALEICKAIKRLNNRSRVSREVHAWNCESLKVRFLWATRLVCCFERKEDAQKFDQELKARMKQFNLEIAEEKSRMIKFGRFARMDLARSGIKPEKFTFLGFDHVCGQDQQGKFAVIRIPSKKSCRKFLDGTKEWLKRHLHWRRVDQRVQLTIMLKGFYQYFGLTHCKSKLDWIHYEVIRQWRNAIKRQSQRHYVYWSYLASKSWFRLPYSKTGMHPTV